MQLLPSKNRRKFIQRTLGGILLVSLASYVYLGFHRYLRGPVLEFDAPFSESVTFTEPVLEISGEAHNVSFLWLNNRQIFTDLKGNFRERILLQTGYNVVAFRAQDSFGRSLEKRYQVALLGPSPDPRSIDRRAREGWNARFESSESNEIATTTEPDTTS